MRWVLAMVAIAACARADAGADGEPANSAAPTATVAAPSATASTAPAPAAKRTPEGMVEIEAGIFLMGAIGVGNPEELPAHEAIVAAFHFDKTEVTMSAYAKCIKAGACTATHQASSRFCNERLEGRGDHPVNCVDWFQAEAFCKWAGKRLPAESEWEYAASGGQERRRFSWGDEEPTPKRSCYDHPGGSCPVASFAPGAFGLHDVTGNVWEWTGTRFLPYPGAKHFSAAGAPTLYVYRGGSWSRRFSKWMRNALRNRYEPHELSASIGMRCAKSIEPMVCPPDTEPHDGSCRRVRGTPLSEAGQRNVPQAAAFDGSKPDSKPGSKPTEPEAVSDTITRTRTPQHDLDCQKHWPKQPVSYLFKGGKNFPARKPLLAAAGCSPRDMGTSWTSTCCPN